MYPRRAQRTSWISLGPSELHRVKNNPFKSPGKKSAIFTAPATCPGAFLKVCLVKLL